MDGQRPGEGRGDEERGEGKRATLRARLTRRGGEEARRRVACERKRRRWLVRRRAPGQVTRLR
jgi:hypothetical protein